MNRDDFRRATPPVPEHFLHAMDDGLRRIERMNRRKTAYVRRMIIAVAVIAALATGAAVAMNERFGIFDFLNTVVDPVVPLADAEKVIQSDIAMENCDFGSLAVEEIAYSGGNYTITVYISAVDGVGFGVPDLEIQNAEFTNTCLGDHYFEDGSAAYMFEGAIIGDAPENLDCKVSVNFATGDEHVGSIALPFQLLHSEGLRARLIPLHDGGCWEVLDAEISLGEVTGTMNVQYRYKPASPEQMDVTLYLFTKDGENLLGDGGSMENARQEDGTLICHEISAIQSLAKLPETLILHPKVIGEAEWLEPIECRVEKID